LLAGYQHHVATDHFAQYTLGQEFFGESVQLVILLLSSLANLHIWQEALIGVKAKVAAVVVGKVQCINLVTDNEQLHEARQGLV